MEVEHRKAKSPVRTLDCDIVKDGMVAMSNLNNADYSKDAYLIVGGVGTQSYLPSTCRRPTGDIDFTPRTNLSFTDFKRFLEPAAQALRDAGYEIRFFRGHSTLKLIYGTPQDGNNMIETSNMGDKRFALYEPIRNKEFERSRMKNIEDRNGEIRVCSPEDIIIPKLCRAAYSIAQYPDYRDAALDLSSTPVNNEFIATTLKNIAEMKEEVIASPSDLDIANRMRLEADLYDVRLLTVLAGYNPELLAQVAASWPYIRDHPAERDLLLKAFLPKFSLN